MRRRVLLKKRARERRRWPQGFYLRIYWISSWRITFRPVRHGAITGVTA